MNVTVAVSGVAEFNAALERVSRALDSLGEAMRENAYSIATLGATLTRADRDRWPRRPLWQRIWLTYRREGW